MESLPPDRVFIGSSGVVLESFKLGRNGRGCCLVIGGGHLPTNSEVLDVLHNCLRLGIESTAEGQEV